MDCYLFKKRQIMSSGKFESPTKRCRIVSWNPESKAVLCNFTFSLLFADLFQVWNRNDHCCLQDIIHLGLGPSSEDADYLILINCSDIVGHKRPIDLSGSSVSAIKPKRTLGSRMGKHVSPVRPLAIKSLDVTWSHAMFVTNMPMSSIC